MGTLKIAAIFLLVAGLGIAGLALAADVIGLGEAGGGIGPKQTRGIIVGGFWAVLGLILLVVALIKDRSS